MNPNKERIIKLQVKKTMENLEKNNMGVSFIPSAKDLPALISSLIPKDSLVGAGGSMTLQESGIIDALKNGDYRFIDRNVPGISAEDKYQKNMEGLQSDVYLSSANAITQRGELYFVDGTNNRLAALLYGPKKVYVVVGYNKIVANVKEAVNRVKQMAAPTNSVRFNKETFCVKHGHCVAPLCDENHLMAIPPGACDEGICSSFLLLGHQSVKERIHVLIVGEELGY